jgi:hypothetical protein
LSRPPDDAGWPGFSGGARGERETLRSDRTALMLIRMRRQDRPMRPKGAVGAGIVAAVSGGSRAGWADRRSGFRILCGSADRCKRCWPDAARPRPRRWREPRTPLIRRPVSPWCPLPVCSCTPSGGWDDATRAPGFSRPSYPMAGPTMVWCRQYELRSFLGTGSTVLELALARSGGFGGAGGKW